MNSAKSTRRALTSSLIALVLCLTMLMGTTFAWFTDTANVSVNTITSGNLKIKLVDADDGITAVSDLKFENSKGETNILWEPGATFNTNAFKVVNDGSLALKFKVVVTGIEGDTGLLKVIDFKLVGPEGVKDEVSLGVGETSGAYYISGTMDTAANNDYQGLELTGISITVYATQDTVEYDSTTDDYDEKAEYDIPEPPVDPYAGYTVVNVASQEELDAAVAAATEPTVFELAAGTYTFYNNGSYSNKKIVFKGTANVVIDATGLGNEVYGDEITFDNVTMNFPATDHKGITHTNKVVFNNCTLTGTQTLYAPSVTFNSCTFKVSGDNYAVWTYGIENAVFNDCIFNTSGKAILCYHEAQTDSLVANVTLTNCVFNDDGALNTTKAAVETGSDGGNTATSNKYNLTFTDCTVNGFDANNSTSPLWGNKNSMDTDHLNVVIDNVDVY